MTRQASQLILLADHSKLGLTSRLNYADISDVTTLVTDSGATTLAAVHALQKVLSVIVAS